MNKKNWLLYGAYGYTGRLLAVEAVSRGHRPVLAGRSKEKLVTLANELNLEYEIFDLSENNVSEKVADFDLVFHTAGPFLHTSSKMIKACIKGRTNYIDITGELPVLEQNLKFDKEARANKISIISGAGFDVIPTDCMAKYVSDRIDKATHLEIAIDLCNRIECISPGTLKTVFEYLSQSTKSFVRQNGVLIPKSGTGIKKVHFPSGIRTVTPASWADLITAYKTTKIPNITVYVPYSKTIADLAKMNLPEKKLKEWIERNVFGPDKLTRDTEKTSIWVRALNDKGDEAEAWLETIESYRFTAIAGIRSVEKVLEFSPIGALTPALAFGKDFILEIPETFRYDSLELITNLT